MPKDSIIREDKTAWDVHEQMNVAFQRMEKLCMMEIIIVLLANDRRVGN